VKCLPLFHHFEKLKPLVIGKAKNPRCFKNINIDNLPVYWESSKKAWMTGYVFLQWIKKVNQVMKSQKRKLLLFLDNATSHSDSLKLSNVTLRFLPPNTTSKLQPLELGIIRAFKARYRKHMLKHLIAKIDMCDDKISLTKEKNVLDAIHWVNRSWTETTIVTWFRDAGFPLQCPTEIHNEEESDPDDDIPLAQLIRVVRQGADSNELISFEEMFHIEESVHTDETYDGEWEKSLVEQFKKPEDSEISECESDDESDDVEMDNTGSEYSHQDMLRNITHMINFANTKDDRYLKFLLPMQSMTEDTIVRRKMLKKNKEHLICLSVESLLLCHNKTIVFIKVFIQYYTIYYKRNQNTMVVCITGVCRQTFPTPLFIDLP
jgi:hypothetical protein